MRKRNLIRNKKNGRDKSTLFPPHCTRRRPLNGHWLINRVLWYVNTWKSTTMIHLIPSRAAAVAAAFHTVKWAPINQRIHHRLHWWKRAATASIFQLQRHFSFFSFSLLTFIPGQFGIAKHLTAINEKQNQHSPKMKVHFVHLKHGVSIISDQTKAKCS